MRAFYLVGFNVKGLLVELVYRQIRQESENLKKMKNTSLAYSTRGTDRVEKWDDFCRWKFRVCFIN